MPRLAALLFFLLPLALPAARAQFGHQTTVTWKSDVQSVAPGATFTIALDLQHSKGWHSYYLNSGGIEQSPEITWTLPDGATAGPIQWPVPTVKDSFSGKSFVYAGHASLLVDLTAPADVKPGDVLDFTAKAHWQICNQACLDESASHTFSIPVTEETRADPAVAAWFGEKRAALPAPLAQPAALTTTGDTFTLHLKSADQPTDFIPDQPYLASAKDGGSITKAANGWDITLPIRKTDFFNEPITTGDSVSGILLTAGAPRQVAHTVITAVAATSKPPPSPTSFPLILSGMFLGGLILNLMPCVFPVIGLKILGFVEQAGGNRRHIILHGLAFAGGVFVSFAIIAGSLFALGGKTWGYQLQNPWVILALLVLMLVLALNMAGVFELGTSATSLGSGLQSKKGAVGSFFTGVLATVVATPCSAPFLGGAIAAAVQLPTVGYFTAFAAMALGLSTPYLVLSSFPHLVEKLPRPGPWMESLKQGMSFLLFATVGYLLWVYTGQTSTDHLLNTFLGLTLIAAACWVWGRWNLPYRSRTARTTAMALGALLFAGGLLFAKPPAKSDLVWEPWSQEKVDAILAEGRPVYIDFTAKWCLTCQTNKRTAYTRDVIAAMRKQQVATLRADKTNDSPAIDAAIRRYGREAIPVNVLERPHKAPKIFPEILTPSILLDGLKTEG